MSLYKKVLGLVVSLQFITEYWLLARERNIYSLMLINFLVDIFTPNFVEIKSKDVYDIASTLKKCGIKYPFVCKPLIAYGFSDAHKVR